MDRTKKTSRVKWLKTGYEHFAQYGPEKLSINKISKDIKSSRASFYHHFGDTDVFFEEILDYYFEEFMIFTNNGIENCKVLIPDVYNHLADNKTILEFSRQLFLNRHISSCINVFNKAFELASTTFMLELFAEKYQLNPNNKQTSLIWLTVGESWFSRIDPKNLSGETLVIIAEDVLQSMDLIIQKETSIQISN